MTGTSKRTAALFLALALILPLTAFTPTAADIPGSGVVPWFSNVPGWELPDLWTRWGVMPMGDLYGSIPYHDVDSGTEIWMVQFEGPIMKEWRDALAGEGVSILEYLPDYTYVVALNDRHPEDLLLVDHVVAVGPFPAVMKMDPDIYSDLEDGSDIESMLGEDRLLVDLFHPIDGIEDLLGKISPGVEKGSGTRYLIGPTISGREDLLSIDGIKHIEPYYHMELHNDIARNITSVTYINNTLGLDGTGQIVAISDTGLDTGVDDHNVTGDIHLDFDNRATIVNWAGTSPDDGHSHGTHTTGSIAGSGARSNGKIKGMAPNASIFFQAIMSDSGGLVIPANTSLLFQQAYENGSRIHSNSWGASYAGAYTSRSQDVDWFLFNYPDMIILYSAGNSGVDWSPEDGRIDRDNIGAPASAKNCITVGASENNRSSGGYQFNWGLWNGWRYTSSGWSYESRYPLDPVYSDYISDNEDGLAAFSSRGPTDDGRIKPDVVAPGTNILSCRSSVSGAGTGWGVYDSYYVYMGGTSMSTPITAGAAVLVRQFYNQTLGLDSPSGALLKATLINGAVDMTPGQYGYLNSTVQEVQGRPDMSQGWGRINLSESLSPPGGNLAFIDDKEGIWTGASVVSHLSVTNSSRDLRVTLAYSDSPGATYAAKELVNDLDLTLVAPNGTEYNGNDWTTPFNDTHDRTNPVEGVLIHSPATGLWKVVISGYNVPMGPQHFAVVASGVISNFSGVVLLDREFYSTDGDRIDIRVMDQDLIGQGTVSVRVTSDTDTAGIQATLNETGISGLFEGTVWTRNSSTGNSSSIQVSDEDNITVTYRDTDPDGNFSSIAVAKDPVRVDLWFRPEYLLIHSEGERFHLEGIIDENVSAWWTFRGIDMGWRRFHDDGNSTFGDSNPYDLNVSDIWYVPGNISGNHTLLIRVNDPVFGNRTYENFAVSFNTSLPRFPKDVRVDPLPEGNSVKVMWSLSNETDLSHYRIYVNNSGTGIIAPPGWMLLSSTSSVTDNLNITGLADGVEYSFRVSVLDVNGNESSLSVPYNATPEDITPPDIILITTPRTIVGTVEFRFTGSPDLSFIEMEFYNDSNSNGLMDDGDWEPIGSGPAPSLSWDTTRGGGGPGDVDSMWIRYRGQDEVPNTSPWSVVTGFRIDNTGPSSVEILNPPPVVTKVPSHFLSGHSEPEGWVEIRINDVLAENVSCNGLGGFTFYMNLTEGRNTVLLSAYDRYGAGPTNRSYNFTLDTMVPEASLDIEDPHHIIRDISMDVYWFNSTSRDLGIDPEYTFIENMTWRMVDPIGRVVLFYGMDDLPYRFMDLGNYTLMLTVRDPARNINSTTVNISVVDITAPVVGIEGSLVVDERSTATFDPNVTDNDEFWLHRTENPVLWEFRGEGFEMNITEITARVSFPRPGMYTVRLTVVDGGGNTANVSANITVRDVTPPEGHIDAPDEVILGIPALFTANMTDNDPRFPDGALFMWNLSYMDGPPETWWSVFPNGSSLLYNFTQPGYYMLTLTCLDASGNERNVQMPFTAVGDLTPPRIDSIFPAPNASFQFPEDLRFTVTFNEPVNVSTITFDTIKLLNGSGGLVGISIVPKGDSEVQVVPVDLDFGMTYSLVIGSDIEDLWGNSLVRGMTANYTIRTLFALDFPDGVYPSGMDDNFTGNDEDIYNITLRFTNPVQVSSVINGITVRSVKMEDVNGFQREVRTEVSFFVVNPGEDEYTVIVSIPLDMGTRYNITLDTNVRDVFDYQLDRIYQWDVMTYMPQAEPTVQEDDDGGEEVPDWLLQPFFWIIVLVIIFLLLLLFGLMARSRRKRHLDRIWEADTERAPGKRMPEPETPLEGGEEELYSGETSPPSIGEAPPPPASPPPSYEDLYGNLYGELSVDEEGPRESGTARVEEGIEWDEDREKEQRDAEGIEEEEEEEEWDDEEGWEEDEGEDEVDWDV